MITIVVIGSRYKLLFSTLTANHGLWCSVINCQLQGGDSNISETGGSRFYARPAKGAGFINLCQSCWKHTGISHVIWRGESIHFRIAQACRQSKQTVDFGSLWQVRRIQHLLILIYFIWEGRCQGFRTCKISRSQVDFCRRSLRTAGWMSAFHGAWADMICSRPFWRGS